MHWLSEYKWLFDGVLGALLLSILGYVVNRSLLGRNNKKPSRDIISADNLTTSPIASGTGVIQNVINIENPMTSSPKSQPVTSLQPTDNAPKPNIRQTGTRIYSVREFHTGRFIEDPTGSGQAFVIEFTNEARPEKANSGVTLKASLLYENKNKEVLRIIACWMKSDSDSIRFKVEDTYELLVGIVAKTMFGAISIQSHGGYFDRDLHPIQDVDTLRIRLTNANNGDLLYEGRFKITISPPTISPLS